MKMAKDEQTVLFETNPGLDVIFAPVSSITASCIPVSANDHQQRNFEAKKIPLGGKAILVTTDVAL